MKKLLTSSIIFSILMITACSAQQSSEVAVTRFAKVTVTLPSPTETPTPLPTPSPQFLLPQEVKEKFELAGIDLAQMENAEYDKDGLHITLPGGEVIVLTNTDLQKGIYNGQDNVLQYRDETNQNVIYTFDKETGKWGVEVSEAESAAIALFDKYGVDPDAYTLAEVDGVIVGTDNKTGTEIFRDGRFEISYAVDLAKKDCEPTNFEPDNTRYEQIKNKDSSLLRYLDVLANDSNVYPYLSGRIQDVLIDRAKKCWGFTDGYSFVYRAYRDEVSLGQKIPIIRPLKDERGWFIVNR